MSQTLDAYETARRAALDALPRSPLYASDSIEIAKVHALLALAAALRSASDPTQGSTMTDPGDTTVPHPAPLAR